MHGVSTWLLSGKTSHLQWHHDLCFLARVYEPLQLVRFSAQVMERDGSLLFAVLSSPFAYAGEAFLQPAIPTKLLFISEMGALLLPLHIHVFRNSMCWGWLGTLQPYINPWTLPISSGHHPSSTRYVDTHNRKGNRAFEDTSVALSLIICHNCRLKQDRLSNTCYGTQFTHSSY